MVRFRDEVRGLVKSVCATRVSHRLRTEEGRSKRKQAPDLAGELLRTCDVLRDRTLPQLGVVVEVSKSARRTGRCQFRCLVSKDRNNADSVYHEVPVEVERKDQKQDTSAHDARKIS